MAKPETDIETTTLSLTCPVCNENWSYGWGKYGLAAGTFIKILEQFECARCGNIFTSIPAGYKDYYIGKFDG